MRTVFDLLDSVFDGCPIWGPKAAASGVAKGIKSVQVRGIRPDGPREQREHRGRRGGGAEDGGLACAGDATPAFFYIA
jgi:hypothetical protein